MKGLIFHRLQFYNKRLIIILDCHFIDINYSDDEYFIDAELDSQSDLNHIKLYLICSLELQKLHIFFFHIAHEKAYGCHDGKCPNSRVAHWINFHLPLEMPFTQKCIILNSTYQKHFLHQTNLVILKYFHIPLNLQNLIISPIQNHLHIQIRLHQQNQMNLPSHRFFHYRMNSQIHSLKSHAITKSMSLSLSYVQVKSVDNTYSVYYGNTIIFTYVNGSIVPYEIQTIIETKI